MRKSTILWLIVGSILLAIIGAVVLIPATVAATSHCTQAQINNGTCQVDSAALGTAGFIGIVLWILASILGLAAWILALIRSASMHSWVWFVVILLISGLGTLLYALFGPRDGPQEPAYYPPNYPPLYPSDYPTQYQPPYPQNYPQNYPQDYPQNYPQDYPPTQRPPAMG